jgi:hypothetical protein
MGVRGDDTDGLLLTVAQHKLFALLCLVVWNIAWLADESTDCQAFGKAGGVFVGVFWTASSLCVLMFGALLLGPFRQFMPASTNSDRGEQQHDVAGSEDENGGRKKFHYFMTCLSACLSHVLFNASAYYYYGSAYFRECHQRDTHHHVFVFFMSGAFILSAELVSMTMYLSYIKDEKEARLCKDD